VNRRLEAIGCRKIAVNSQIFR